MIGRDSCAHGSLKMHSPPLIIPILPLNLYYLFLFKRKGFLLIQVSHAIVMLEVFLIILETWSILAFFHFSLALILLTLWHTFLYLSFIYVLSYFSLLSCISFRIACICIAFYSRFFDASIVAPIFESLIL